MKLPRPLTCNCSCFNTVAVLFMCETDNLAYLFGLPEQTRARMESVDKVELDQPAAARLSRLKLINFFIVELFLLATPFYNYFTQNNIAFMGVLPLFGLGAMLDEALAKGVEEPLGQRLCKVVGQMVAAFFVGMCIGLSYEFLNSPNMM